MRVLVTGGSGFVGHAVVRALARAGHAVTVLSHSKQTHPDASTVVRADLTERAELVSALAGQSFDGVCHLAALTRVRESFAEPLRYYAVNVGGTMNLLSALAANGSTPAVVFVSTGAIYGGGAEGRLAETAPARPESPYAASKHAAETLLEYHAQTGAIGAAVLRCFSIAGALDGVGDPDETRILPKALRVAAGLAPAVRINGDGSAVREFTHVLDVADACRLALDAIRLGEHRLYNVGSDLAVSMGGLVAAVAERTERDVPIEHDPPKPEPHTLMADSSKIRAELGWTAPASTLERIIDDGWQALDH